MHEKLDQYRRDFLRFSTLVCAKSSDLAYRIQNFALIVLKLGATFLVEVLIVKLIKIAEPLF